MKSSASEPGLRVLALCQRSAAEFAHENRAAVSYVSYNWMQMLYSLHLVSNLWPLRSL